MTEPARISLLLPTYRRPLELAETLANVRRKADKPGLLEIIVHTVFDDHETGSLALGHLCDLRITSHHVGYQCLPEAINLMAKVATGDWLFPFADDVVCETRGWDQVIRRFDHKTPMLLSCENNHGNSIWFPILSRTAYERIGCVTRSQFHDIWLQDVFRWADLWGNVRLCIPAKFTNRVVAKASYHGLSPQGKAEYQVSAKEAGERLAGVKRTTSSLALLDGLEKT